jgi:hypothetical protein
MRTATARELHKLLSENGANLRNLLGEPRAQLSLPTDGKGLRVLAEIPTPGTKGLITLTFRLEGQDLAIPVELADTFEHYRTSV